MATSTNALIERAASTYILTPPSDTEITAIVSRIDAGSLTLVNAIQEVEAVGASEDIASVVARMFFLLLDRAPDPVLHDAAMSALRTGSTLNDIANIGLQYSRLMEPEAGGDLTDSEFVDLLVDRMWFSPPNGFNSQAIVNVLAEISRAELVVNAATYFDNTLRYANKVDPALAYLVAANRQATTLELDSAVGKPSATLLREVLINAGEDPFSGKPLITKSGNTLFLEGVIDDDLTINLVNGTASLGGIQGFQYILTTDGGATEATTTFNSSLLNGITRLDATDLSTSSTGAITLLGGQTVLAGGISTTLGGSSNADTLTGSLGDDTLSGGAAGSDTLTGGLGVDTFIFRSTQTYKAGESLTVIADFGFGEDVLDFSQLLGSSEPESLTTLTGVGDPASADFPDLATLERDNVVVIEYAGTWPSGDPENPTVTETGSLTARTATQIANLFSDVTFDTTPTRGSKTILISTDQTNGADVWLIENLTQLATIEVGEITKVGTIDSDFGDLFPSLIRDGAVIG